VVVNTVKIRRMNKLGKNITNKLVAFILINSDNKIKNDLITKTLKGNDSYSRIFFMYNILGRNRFCELEDLVYRFNYNDFLDNFLMYNKIDIGVEVLILMSDYQYSTNILRYNNFNLSHKKQDIFYIKKFDELLVSYYAYIFDKYHFLDEIHKVNISDKFYTITNNFSDTIFTYISKDVFIKLLTNHRFSTPIIRRFIEDYKLNKIVF